MQFVSILAGFTYAIISLAITRKLVKKERINEINNKIKQLQNKELTENERVEILKLFNESLILQMKPIFVILPIFFFIYYLLPKEVQFEFVIASIIFGIILNILSEIKIGGKNEKK